MYVGLIYVLLLVVTPVLAQTTSTQILGTVVDPTGAAVPDAAVEAVRVHTGEKRTATTNQAGDYIIPYVEIGEYQVSVEAAGFRREIKRGIVLELNQKARVDFSLRVGEVTETIEVEATAPVLKTDDATLGEVVDRRRITQLPLNGRNFAQLAVLAAPGVRMGYQTFGNAVRLYASGQRENQNQFTMDGIVIQNNLINATSFRPSLEAIEEFQVQTGSFSAEFGMFSGAQVNIALRSGTNAFHATLFEFLRNDRLDARNFFERPGDPKAPLRRNQFGWVFSGPLTLPGLYRGRDRTFFMVNSEFVRHRVGGSRPVVVAPIAFRNGDFSDLLANNRTIRDPLTGRPFPGNIIPRERLSPSALALLRYMPQPNQAGVTNYQGRTRNDSDNNQHLVRIDHVFSPNDRLFGRYIYQTNRIDEQAVVPVDLRSEPIKDQSVALNETHIFRANVVNELRVGYTRLRLDRANPFTNTNFSIQREFGMVGFPEDPFQTGLPEIIITGFLGLSSSGPLEQVDETGQFADNLSWIRGRHSLKMGVDLRKTRVARRSANWPRGQLHFTGEITGHAFADFMLGLPRRANGVERLMWQEARNWRFGTYFQDDWRVTPKLTLNLGIRYELNTVVKDPHGRLLSLDPRDPTRLYPEPGTSIGLYDGDHNNFGPRFGFAYRPFGSRTVFRGGYGIYYNQNQLNNFTLLQRNPPQSLVPTVISDPANPTVTLSNPYSVQGTLPSGPYNIITVDTCRCLPNPYTQMWTFNIQRQISENLGVEVGYIGSLSLHLDRSDQANLPEPGPGPVQARRPLPMWADVRMLRNDVTSTYHALQTQVKRRFSKGLTFLGNYAWSHSIDDGNDFNLGARVQNPRRRDLDRGNSQFDYRHRMTASFVYELPSFVQSSSRAARLVLNGWQTNGIVTLESGQPFTVSARGDPANTGGVDQRADRLANGVLSGSERTLDRWFDTSAFVNPRPFTYGNSGRFILRQAGTKLVDFGLFKNFHLDDRQVIQFRAEFFSFFNTPQFGAPGATVETPTFGRVTTAGGNRIIQLGLKYDF
jgi:hypothetical protein